MIDVEQICNFEQARDRIEELLPQIDPEVARILERALAGREIGEAEGIVLSEVSGSNLAALVAAADLLRERKVGPVVSYVVCRNINFTNVCYVGCKFCAFSTGPGKPDAWDHSLAEVGRRAEEAWDRGATEICMQGGLPRDMSPFYYRDLLTAIRSRAPRIHIHAYSPMEVTYGIELTGLPMEDYLSMLREAGLNTLPGTAAEILDDEVRYVLSKNKVSVAQWIKVITTAHRLGIPTTSTMMYGHRENGTHWVRHMLLLRRDSAADRRIHGVCSSRVRASEHGALPPGVGSARAHCGGTSSGSRPRPRPVERLDSQHPGILGQDGSAHVAALSQSRRQ